MDKSVPCLVVLASLCSYTATSNKLCSIRGNTLHASHCSSNAAAWSSYNPHPHCDPKCKYRSIDGSCNNLAHPEWGSSHTAYTRLLPAHYRDGVYLPPLAADGNPLPSARKLSTAFFCNNTKDDEDAALVAMQWGQFVSHDIAYSDPIDESNINCCHLNDTGNESVYLPIEVPVDDPFYSSFGVSCLPMTRHKFVVTKEDGGAAQHYNTVTHFLDGSTIYGSTPNKTNSLRSFEGGKLLMQTCVGGGRYLPYDNTASSCLFKKMIKYNAGDDRVNQNPQLTILHTLFIREHNRIADSLQRLHPGWNDETLFQEAKAIVTAELQHISYSEWLPLMLGETYMMEKKLYPNGAYHYNPHVVPATMNSFTITFRFGHSGIQELLSVYSNHKSSPVRQFKFSDQLNHPEVIMQEDNFNGLLRGLVCQPMQMIDQHYTEQITQLLFHGDKPYGKDLESLDVQRGRDHGIPPYVKFLQLCTGKAPRTFADLKDIIQDEYIPLLEQNYKSVEDIDLYVGGNLEIPAKGARVGPTFQCIIGEQFYRLKYGDRFWHEIRDEVHSFSDAQLREIKKTSLARIICDNTDITEVSRRSFIKPSPDNPPIQCKYIPYLNLRKWL